MTRLKQLLTEIRDCRACESVLPHEPRPVVAAHLRSKIVLIGQAPGRKVHESGVPWQDASGDRLREWLGTSLETFYDTTQIAIVPMGFCYPGTGKSGDLPPRPECAELWHARLLKLLKSVRLTLLVGNYAQKYFLDRPKSTSLTDTVRCWKEFLPDFFPLPHPSPRNNLWLRKNPWFESEVLPALKRSIRKCLK